MHEQFLFLYHFLLFSCVVDVNVSAIKDDGVWEDLSSPSIQILIPGPPDPPTLTCKEVTSKHIQLEWSEPRLHGDVKVAGFQVSYCQRLLTSFRNQFIRGRLFLQHKFFKDNSIW